MRRTSLIVLAMALMTAQVWAQQPAPAPAAPATPAPEKPEAPAPKLKPRASAPRARAEAWSFAPRSGAYLGVDIRDVTADRLSALKLKQERGVEITMVDRDAPAGKAGLKAHDVIVSFNGTAVESVEQLRRMIRETPPGRNIALGISRDGQPQNVNVQLADYNRQHAKRFRMEMPPMPPMDLDIPQFTMLQTVSRSGIVVESLTQQLGEYFGVKNAEGVLVRSVEKGSAAESAGIRAGDVIVRVDSERISDMGDWRRVMRARRSGGTLAVSVVRDKREQTISLTLPERKEQSRVYEFEIPDIEIDLEELHQEINRLRPSIEKSMQVAQASAQRTMREYQRSLRNAQRELGRELQRKSKELQREMERAQKEMEQAVEKW